MFTRLRQAAQSVFSSSNRRKYGRARLSFEGLEERKVFSVVPMMPSTAGVMTEAPHAAIALHATLAVPENAAELFDQMQEKVAEMKAKGQAKPGPEIADRELPGNRALDDSSAANAFERMKEKVLEMEARSMAPPKLSQAELEEQYTDTDAELDALKDKMENGAPEEQ